MTSPLKLLYKLLAFLILLVVIDFFTGKAFSYLLNKQSDGRYFKIEYSLDRSDEDIIIIGSSRAETNYNPTIFRNVLSMSCWNAGRGGQTLDYFLSIENEILKRYSPKLIILNMDQYALEGSFDYDRSAILRPYAKRHAFINNLLSQKNWYEKYKLKSNIYTSNSTLFYFLRPFFVKNKDGKQSDKGWKPRNGVIPMNLISEAKYLPNSIFKNNLNPERVLILHKIIDLANQKGIRLIVTFSPDYYPLQRSTSTMDYLTKLYSQKKCIVFNLANDTTFNNKNEYFFDLQHMNNIGANLFSEILATKIKCEQEYSISNSYQAE